MLLTDRDLWLLDCLTWRLKILTLRQAADAAFGGAESGARRRLGQLEGAGLVSEVRLPVKAANLTGGRRRAVRLSETSHDAALAEVYFRQSEERRSRWQGEAVFTATGEGKRPDAWIGRLAVDWLGESYSLAKVEGLASYLIERGCAFEPW